MRPGMEDLLASAPCIDTPPALLFSTDYQVHLRIKRTLCARCPLKAECLQVVRPRQSFFDGTCGARYWLDGVDMSMRLQSPHFRPYTVYQHGHKTGSWRVREALQGKREPSDLNRTELMLFVYAASEAGIPLIAIAGLLGISYQLARTMPPVVKRDAPERVLQSSREWPVKLLLAAA